MLSDALKQMRMDLKSEALDGPEMLRLALMVFELEAANMEQRLFMLTGQEHVPLNGDFMQTVVREAMA